MYNKSGGKVRLTFKLEQDQLWIGTKGNDFFLLLLLFRNQLLGFYFYNRYYICFTERTEKIPMGSIKNVVTEPIEGHEDYHMMVRYFSVCAVIFKCQKNSSGLSKLHTMSILITTSL